MARTHLRLPVAFVLSLLLGLVAVSTTSAASTGRICGQVTAFTAPLVGVNGQIVINGVTEVIAASAAATLAAGTITTLTAVAAADATTCLDITAGAGGVIVGLSISATAQVCGDVAVNSVTGLTSVNGVALPTSLLSANAGLSALLDIALDANADVCVDLAVDTTTGLIVGVAVTADFDVCGTVEVDSAGHAAVGGVAIAANLIDADASAALRLAALVDANACVTVNATTSGTTTTVDVGVTATICATVTAVGNGTLTLEGITLNVVGNAAAGVQVGDEVCVAIAPSTSGGNPITGVSTPTPSGGGTPTPSSGGTPTLLPNTATEMAAPGGSLVLGVLLLLGVGLGLRVRKVLAH